ncbi:hypothetical protein TorRG33x02_303960 [Trema orientale]|uniref:Uncharacterized protein n=1 Tax=Trema orientale TaxID=63057 RepID=A0A2P5BYV3_TREOI|nr:hypothetical protein TorRG33x02_303960 [Trema orientale]
MCSSVDLRYLVLVGVNLLKSQVGAKPSDWYPFNTSHLYYPNASVLVLLLLLFPLTSMKLSLTPSNINPSIRFQFGKFSPHIAILLMGSLIFPQEFFWYAYPAILVSALCFPKLLPILKRFLAWLDVWNLNVLSLTQANDDQVDIESPPHVAEVVMELYGNDEEELELVDCELEPNEDEVELF